MSQTATVALAHFGKIRSRGDFVRSSHTSVVQTLDRWITQGLELMAADPRWKEVYDNAGPLHFAFMGVKSRAVLAGHLMASTDASGRRFPFTVAGTFDVGGPPNHVGVPLAFMARSPMALTRLWARLEQAATQAASATDATPALSSLGQTQVEVESTPQAYDAGYSDFLDLQTLGPLEAMLRQAGHDASLRRILLALGLLLQPVPSSGSSALEKGLCLPLPADPLYLPYVATLWLDLVSRFLSRGDFEIGVFLPSAPKGGAPTLQIGFSGGSASVFQAALDPWVGSSVFVNLSDAEWVESRIENDYGIKKLSSYLEQPQLSLRRAVSTFGEAFLGE